MERAEWLEQRKRFITASDVAALLGLNSSRSASKVIREKAGLAAAEELDEDLLAQVPAGRHMEAGIAAWFLEETPHGTAWGNGNNLMVSPVLPYLGATPDWIVDGQPIEVKNVGETQLVNFYEAGETWNVAQKRAAPKHWPAHLEMPVPSDYRVRDPAEFLRVSPNDKSVKGHWRRSRAHQMQVLRPAFGEPRAPIKYWVQMQMQMHVMSADSGWIVAAIGGTRRIDFLYERDRAFEAYALEVVKNAWETIQQKKAA
jgi:hypothetical protein